MNAHFIQERGIDALIYVMVKECQDCSVMVMVMVIISPP